MKGKALTAFSVMLLTAPASIYPHDAREWAKTGAQVTECKAAGLTWFALNAKTMYLVAQYTVEGRRLNFVTLNGNKG